jgi:hypothetical protein
MLLKLRMCKPKDSIIISTNLVQITCFEFALQISAAGCELKFGEFFCGRYRFVMDTVHTSSANRVNTFNYLFFTLAGVDMGFRFLNLKLQLHEELNYTTTPNFHDVLIKVLNIIVVRHNVPILEGGSLASYIDTQNAFPSVHSAAPQLPLT